MFNFALKLGDIESMVLKLKFANSGDAVEQGDGSLVTQFFPEIETFWQLFVIPLTNRIDLAQLLANPENRIRYRDSVSHDLLFINSYHYSLFLHLVECHKCKEVQRSLILEDFFFHLGCSCDLAEEFLLAYYNLSCDCLGELPEEMTGVSKCEFLEVCANWYDKKYSKYHENYRKKGKAMPIYIPGRQDIIAHLFNDDSGWERYKKIAVGLRNYRNIITHRSFIGRLMTIDGDVLIPKIETIKDYSEWNDVFAVGNDEARLKRDFQEVGSLMREVLLELEQSLNGLWKAVVACQRELLFVQKNPILLAKYNIRVS